LYRQVVANTDHGIPAGDRQQKKQAMEMKARNIQAFAIILISVTLLAGMALAAQNKYTVKALSGLGFSGFKGYIFAAYPLR
jgi:hypothetical protein